MFKRIIIIFSMLLVAGGVFATDVFAGPPWPAEVYVLDDTCEVMWMDKNYNEVSVYGDGIWKVHELNNSISISCQDQVDFDDVATIEQVCSVFPDVCPGNGAIQISRSDLTCWDDDVYTHDSNFVMTPNGHWTLTCNFNGNNPP